MQIPLKARKRVRRPHWHKKTIAKEMVERGIAHTSKTGKEIHGKSFKPQTACQCNRHCPTKIDISRQGCIFDTYYNKFNWSQKTTFIRESIKVTEVKKKQLTLFPIFALKNRNINCEYSFRDTEGVTQIVCRNFFLNCLQVTSTRVHSALKTAIKNPCAIENRGRHPSIKKTPQENMALVKSFIDSIPCYESHYGRSNSQKKYLPQGLSLIGLYREYKNQMSLNEEHKRKIVSENIFRHIFNTEYNLSFKRRHSDTCKSCDEFKMSLKSMVLSSDAKDAIELKRKNHHELVEKTNEMFRNDVKNARESDGKIAVLTFDLQKALETPSITTSIAFYKRQLWTFNFCIYDEVNLQGLLTLYS